MPYIAQHSTLAPVLPQSVRAFAKLAENLSEAIVVVDHTGRLVWQNNSYTLLCGYSVQEMQGNYPGDLLHGPETDGRTVERINFLMREKRPFKAEVLHYHQEGYCYWASMSVSPMMSVDDEVYHFVIVVRDVTEEKRAREEEARWQSRRLESAVEHLKAR